MVQLPSPVVVHGEIGKMLTLSMLYISDSDTHSLGCCVGAFVGSLLDSTISEGGKVVGLFVILVDVGSSVDGFLLIITYGGNVVLGLFVAITGESVGTKVGSVGVYIEVGVAVSESTDGAIVGL